MTCNFRDLPSPREYRVWNGGKQCDMWTGACSCGAAHKAGDLRSVAFVKSSQRMTIDQAQAVQVRPCPACGGTGREVGA